MNDRLSALRACFDEWQVDALLLISPANRRWASGFTGSAAQLLISRQRAVLATDSRYWERAAAEAPAFEIFQMRDEKDAMANFLATSSGAQPLSCRAQTRTRGLTGASCGAGMDGSSAKQEW